MDAMCHRYLCEGLKSKHTLNVIDATPTAESIRLTHPWKWSCFASLKGNSRFQCLESDMITSFGRFEFATFLHWCTWVFIPKALPCHFCLSLTSNSGCGLLSNEVPKLIDVLFDSIPKSLIFDPPRSGQQQISKAENGMSRCKRLFSTRLELAIFYNLPFVRCNVFNFFGGVCWVVALLPLFRQQTEPVQVQQGGCGSEVSGFWQMMFLVPPTRPWFRSGAGCLSVFF